jgi:mannose-1-phosphate guanylyltransferase
MMTPATWTSREQSTTSAVQLGQPARRTDIWAIVLAGGEGVRLRPLVRRVLGDERPKQYVPLLGERTLLGQTLARVGLGIPAERTIVVTMDRHADYTAQELGREPHPHLLAQPADCGTAAAILAPTHRVARLDPGATVAVFPSDHYIGAEARFMAYIAEIASWVDTHPDRVVLLGARATRPEVEYGWIEPGEILGDASTGPVRAVRQFWEKPSLVRAKLCLASGHLWNTSVVIGKARTLLKVGRLGTPGILEALDRFAEVTPDARALALAYEGMPRANFSRDVLQACPQSLAVARMPRLEWSDLGSPRRVMEVIETLGTRPAWARRAPMSA